MEIAVAHGFLPGARLPDTVYVRPLHFADQEWKQPNRSAYMTALAAERPALATVLDWEKEAQLPEVLDWAEEAAQYVREAVIIIPKIAAGIARLPRRIVGKEVRLGYSVPTRFGGTFVPAWEFSGWPIHLLGGQPHSQMRLARYIDVRSVDGNYAQKMALRYCQFWVPGDARYAAKGRWWPTLRETDGMSWGTDAPYEAFRRSCQNIVEAWRRWPA